jgi:hypothetical protein
MISTSCNKIIGGVSSILSNKIVASLQKQRIKLERCYNIAVGIVAVFLSMQCPTSLEKGVEIIF